ncbi:MAG: bifunctional demethylmenaquinone methyltransferase/2-methoxy-6-polyprenyl-1,4-benzoquinol methylase UbiE [Burkholderiales bacterium]|nr:bifunctional demethylmenaquinone methyltransferase/2-methoxy-6-polyprenyl-1,4-benzoquinol methylase UbiE [Phycisphaerae bacterium]
MGSDQGAAWDDSNLNDPHAVADKRSRVQKMFTAIAPSYDLNNRVHSFWRDQAWRRKAVKLAKLKPMDVVVDVACGTGDLTLAFARGVNSPVIGIDFTHAMLPIANRKSQIANPPTFLNADATALPLPDESADVVSIAFGIRNVQAPEQALREFHRVLRPGGRVIVLEFSEPTNPLIRAVNRFYCGRIMPITATLISGDKSGAYKYLPKSIGTFWSREKMVAMLDEAGFIKIEQHPMTFGVCVCYRGEKALVPSPSGRGLG